MNNKIYKTSKKFAIKLMKLSQYDYDIETAIDHFIDDIKFSSYEELLSLKKDIKSQIDQVIKDKIEEDGENYVPSDKDIPYFLLIQYKLLEKQLTRYNI